MTSMSVCWSVLCLGCVMSKRRQRQFPGSRRRFRPPSEGIARLPEEAGGSVHRFLATILELAGDGVIRAGKKSFEDTAVGFWIGVDPADGLAKLNIGDADAYVQWDGAVLSVRGDITANNLILFHDDNDSIIDFRTKGGDVRRARIRSVDIAGGDQRSRLELLSVSDEDHLTRPADIRLQATDDDYDSTLTFSSLGIEFWSNFSPIQHVMAGRVSDVDDATEDGDAVSRGFGDGRYSGAAHAHSHTALSDIGTNTHPVIDAHLGSTSNPHSVTVAQIGALADDGSVPVGGDFEVDGYLETDAGGFTPAVENLVSNPSFEDGSTSGWWKGGINTITAVTTRSVHGDYSLESTYQDDNRMAYYSISGLVASTQYIASIQIYIPGDWDGGGMKLSDDGTFGGATGEVRVQADMGLTDQWQTMTYTFTTAVDVSGTFVLRAASAPSVGKKLYFDNFQLTLGDTVLPFSSIGAMPEGISTMGALSVLGLENSYIGGSLEVSAPSGTPAVEINAAYVDGDSQLIFSENSANSMSLKYIGSANRMTVSDILGGIDIISFMRTSGYVGIGTLFPTSLLDINSDTMRLRTAKTPASASDAGNQGDIAWDSSYIYICTATDTWRRVAHSTW